MFRKNQTQKELEELENITKAISDLESELPNLKARQKELQDSLSQKLGFKTEQKKSSDEVTEVTKKIEKKLDDGTYFVKPANIIKARTILKANSIKAKVVKSKGKDYFVEPTKEQNTDEFNKFMKTNEEIKAVYHWSGYTRKVKN